ncbi:MFS transporter [Candidatus Trichorickettsia mobilis]|uniref:MFS transporter n=1 Tax=Candidatus Trichorickettsia mobilis TaxID=1346319 RepID=A0ABZ0UTZ6_9RICK|nr:multidrug effflux MFS transporter [Candidatus Trichorickettsia mobilis]WPY00971.1 MFS transporter [Candidatus Trichorickettsia mobilis]
MMARYLPFLLIVALVNSCIELEISAPSFLDIAKQLQVPDSMVGLTITYNLFGFCLAALIYGPLSESYGRRKIMLIGNLILVIGAIGCVFASSIEELLIARFIQGVGAATSAVVVSAIIADSYNIDKATQLYGVMNAIFTTIMALAPIIGGFINKEIGWRGNYAFVAVICLTSLILLCFFLPETLKKQTPLAIKSIFVDYKTLLTNPIFLSASAVPSLCYGVYMAFIAISPFLYMQTFKLGMLSYTLHQGVVIAVFAIVSLGSGQIIKKLGTINAIYLGLVLYIIGSIVALFANSPYVTTFSLSICGIGSAIFYPIIFVRSIEIFPELKGTASSAIMSMRYVLCSALTWIASYSYDGTPATFAHVIIVTTLFIVLFTAYLKNSVFFHLVKP